MRVIAESKDTPTESEEDGMTPAARHIHDRRWMVKIDQMVKISQIVKRGMVEVPPVRRGPRID